MKLNERGKYMYSYGHVHATVEACARAYVHVGYF